MSKSKTLYGFGIYDGDKLTTTIIDGKRVMRLGYSRWNSLIKRTNDPREKASQPHYASVYCSEEWRFFSDFEVWLEKQPYWTDLHLDKDILIPGNKEYGPDTCVFIPQYLNNVLYLKAKTGDLLPGVRRERNGKYTASTLNSFINVPRGLGTFETQLEAHAAWQVGKAYVIECAITKYASEPWFRTDVADALMRRVWELRLNATTGTVTTSL